MKKYWVIDRFIDHEDGWEVLVFDKENDIPQECIERYGVYSPTPILASNKTEAIRKHLEYDITDN